MFRVDYSTASESFGTLRTVVHCERSIAHLQRLWRNTNTMSSTQTQTEPTTVREVLRTYDTHYSEQREETASEPPIPVSTEADSSEQSPTNWSSDWHRTPQYRAVSRTHRVSDRAAGVDNVEGTMVMGMFTGVYIQGVRARDVCLDLEVSS